MAKWYGTIGFTVHEIKDPVKHPHVYTDSIIERKYYGELIKNTRRWQQASNQVNDNLTLSNTLSILADPYLTNNLGNIRYVIFMGAKWKVSEISYEFRRLTLTLGELYNG